MKAADRTLPDWFGLIRRGSLNLPRFQRFEAWEPRRIEALLESVLQDLPAGVALILNVGDKPRFDGRPLAHSTPTEGRITEQLLDGQQRLTALWASLNDKYDDRTYVLRFVDDPSNSANTLLGGTIPDIESYGRYMKAGKRYPLWLDDPQESLNRGYVPLRLLSPDDETLEDWLEEAIPDEVAEAKAKQKEWRKRLGVLRTRIREFNLPYLALPSETAPEVALDVFIKLNTGSAALTPFDILVAQVEDATGTSLHEHMEALVRDVPAILRYGDETIRHTLVLDTAALLQDKVPNIAGYTRLNFKQTVEDWPRITKGLAFMVGLLEDFNIADIQRLPSTPPLPVIAAIAAQTLERHTDDLGNIRILLRRYMWRAFLTARYERSSKVAALQDYRGIMERIQGGKVVWDTLAEVPVFNPIQFPLPKAEDILQQGWPTRQIVLSRALLALQLACGADDLADGGRATVANLTNEKSKREYHHLFPDAVLREAGLPKDKIYRAVNCALITWRTNRKISAKEPAKYLLERAEASVLGHDELSRRLNTHLIPVAEFNVHIPSEGDWKGAVIEAYERFTQSRAQLLEKAINVAAEGMPLSFEAIVKN
jgi:hypothetical protein